MKTRKPLALAGAAALALTTGLVMTANPSQAAATKSYAYGFSINGEGKQPYVESTDGTTQTQGGEPIPENPLLHGNIAELKAGDDFASVRVANLTVGELTQELPPELTEAFGELEAACTEAVKPIGDEALAPVLDGVREEAPTELQFPSDADVVAFCNDLLDDKIPALAAVDTIDIECDGDSGSVTVAGVTLLGAELPLAGEIEPNTKLFAGDASPLADAVQVTFNRQTQRPNGAFDVDAVVVELGGGEGEIILGHTTCGEPLPAEKPEGRAPTPPRAEAPEPVRQSVPVTG